MATRGAPTGTDLLEVLLDIAAEAGALVAQVYATDFGVEYKAPRDPVTRADRLANELICRRLGEAFPGVPVVAEESDPATFAGFRAASRVFFVDPLDGTREFIDRNGEFAVMIGVLDGARATAGVILAPALGTAWAGAVGHGAWRVEADGSRRRVRVSEVADLARARAVASRSHRDEALERALAAVNPGTRVVRGSAGLKGADVASGAAEIYVAPGPAGKRWDACAADALVTAAGGRYTDAYGALFDYRAESVANRRGIVATNGRLHDAVLAGVARARASS
jgi:3'(2'), 5'-bisphosphate nucleotidase